MGKTKKAKANTRNWLDQNPTLAMKREVENATAHLCLQKKIEPSKMTRDSVTFVDLLPYLKVEHDRWDDIEPSDFTTTRPKCIKLLYDHYPKTPKPRAKFVFVERNMYLWIICTFVIYKAANIKASIVRVRQLPGSAKQTLILPYLTAACAQDRQKMPDHHPDFFG